MVGICGLARAGKSTFSHALVRSLGRLGVKALTVRLDDWILPLPGRTPGMSSAERCRVHLYPGILSTLMAGGTITVEAYDAASRAAGEAITYRRSDERVIILDGVHACHAALRRGLDLALMVEAEGAELDRRFLAFYRWKGESEESAARLLLERKDDEWPEVLSQRTMVDEVVRLEPIGRTG